MNKPIRIGAVNWDAGLTSDTYFGHYMINTLSNPKFTNRLPYYAKIDASGEYYLPCRSIDAYSEELEIAANGGIDFFMYCWYPDGTQPCDIGQEKYPYLVSHYPELNRMRKLYQQSPNNKKINMCAILLAVSAYSKKDFEDLFFAMKQDYYEKKDGRPLLFIFGGYDAPFISKIKELASDEGINPYIIFMNNGKISQDGDYSLAQAVSAYASSKFADTFEDFCLRVQDENENRKKYGIPVIPILSAGWNPNPRIDRPSPWIEYAERTYAPAPTADQIEKATIDYFRWIKENSDFANTGYGVVFAWNEFEEGGYLCPTLNTDGKPCSDILDGLAKALKSK